ncbi:MAG: hypothetical protein ACK5LP_09165 [Campylobacteraceae bacterium]
MANYIIYKELSKLHNTAPFLVTNLLLEELTIAKEKVNLHSLTQDTIQEF